ncbi:MAG: DNA polymerase III subunit gamma/tau [Candidatus Dadabacteria bacterium]|nr:MAG: DNA polymerase III subunit gamma/tau [Candidatus Dadabacteria bacterium]
MSYLVLARKYRPTDFSSVVGQEHVTRTLRNSIKRGKIAHAYLFCGPRGVGKTSVARIFARALNCTGGPNPDPPADDPNGLAVAAGTSLAVREIDGASHNSVDNVRELIESFRSLPPPGWHYKIYIIDEVHMLSTSAFNALLKSLEEPPPNTVFILATTEPHKIPDTVISRCQRHDFRALSPELIVDHLNRVCKSEQIEIEPEALRMIARYADGSMRDAQSLLDRVHSFCEGKITAKEASQALGTVERGALFKLSEAIINRDHQSVFLILDNVFASGVDIALFLREFVLHWRELLMAAAGGEKVLKELGINSDYTVDLKRQAGALSLTDLQDLVQLARRGADEALRSAYPRYALEALVVRMAGREPVKELGQIVAMLKNRSVQALNSDTSAASLKRRVESSSEQQKAVVESQKPKADKNITASSPLDWGAFVSFVAKEGSPMVAEHMKRLSVETFDAGILVASGPEFSTEYLERSDNKARLCELLSSFSGIDKWKINITKGNGDNGIEPGSLREQEEQRLERERRMREKKLVEHPAIKQLKEVFPDSEIEQIKLKE